MIVAEKNRFDVVHESTSQEPQRDPALRRDQAPLLINRNSEWRRQRERLLRGWREVCQVATLSVSLRCGMKEAPEELEVMVENERRRNSGDRSGEVTSVSR